MNDPVVFFQHTTGNADQFRLTECVYGARRVHLEAEMLSGTKVVVCLDDYEAEQLQEALTDWLRYVDGERMEVPDEQV